jgi:chemotaxis protein methyltransferase CheR
VLGPAASADVARLFQHARTLADRGDLDEAHRLCQSGLSRDRLSRDGYLLLAAICQELGDIPAALDALRRLIFLAPESAPAHFLRGSLLFQARDHRSGRRSMEVVVRLLQAVPGGRVLPDTNGMIAGRLLESAQAYLAMGDELTAVRARPLRPDRSRTGSRDHVRPA